MSLKQLNLRRSALAAAAALIVLIGLDWAFPPPIAKAAARSAMVTDRTGKPLRAFALPDGRWRFQARLDEVDPLFLDALLMIEDKRFYRHAGVDWLAMIRAAATSARAGHIVSGGSTISMQTARLLEPRPRNIPAKLIEMVRATQLERRLSKTEILELYLTLAPYGGNLEGIRAASLGWFGHEPTTLTDDEIALLVALPQSPEMRRPDRRPDRARKARAFIAAKLEQAGVITPRRQTEINMASLPERQIFPAQSWHGAAQARLSAGGGDTRSTLDAGLQADLEGLIRAHADLAGDRVQIAAMLVDIPSRAVRAMIGSASRARDGGWIDLTRAKRSPGSTLKPFIYAMSFDDGFAAPGTVISDLPKRFAAYQPENFDRSFRGDVTIAEALQHSLNVPAVLALDRIGPERFAAQLRVAGTMPSVQGGAGREAGLALALGGAGLSLRELAVLYAALGDGGVAKPLIWNEDQLADAGARSGQRFLSAVSSDAILKILREAPSPAGRIPGRLTRNAPQIAFKTGTSYGFRDAWAAGISGDSAIIVWVGRADGAPRPGHTGRSAALPILFEIADRAAARLAAEDANADRIRADSRHSPTAALVSFTPHRTGPEILFPPKNAELWGGSVDGQPARGFVLAGRGEGILTWYIDGVPCPVDAGGLPLWTPDGPGFYTLTLVDEGGQSARLEVRVIG